jgi:rod shape-determining protein MreC
MSEHGLVGRVAGVARGASRVLLLTDPPAARPVLIDRTNARAILTGDGGPNPRLEFLRGAAPAREGDAILTSGDGGVFPRGLPVGVAVKGIDGVWRARLYSDRSPIDYVRILLFDDFARLVDQRAIVDGIPPVIAPRRRCPAPRRSGSEPGARSCSGAGAPPARLPTRRPPAPRPAQRAAPAPQLSRRRPDGALRWPSAATAGSSAAASAAARGWAGARARRGRSTLGPGCWRRRWSWRC